MKKNFSIFNEDFTYHRESKDPIIKKCLETSKLCGDTLDWVFETDKPYTDYNLGRKYFEKMYTLGVKEIMGYDEHIKKIFGKDGPELITEFLEAKMQITIELFAHTEDVIQNKMEEILGKDEWIQEIKKNHPKYLDDIIISKKIIFYEKELSQYFKAKDIKKVLQHFTQQCRDQGSFFVALERTKIKHSITSRKDRINLLIILRRYIDIALKEREKDISIEIIEYVAQDVMIKFFNNQHLPSSSQGWLFCILECINNCESPHRDNKFMRIIEYVVFCLLGVVIIKNKRQLGDNLIKLEEYLSTGELQKDYQKLLYAINNVVIKDKPFIEEEGFYGSYPKRFNLEERRIRETVRRMLEDHERDRAGSELKKLSQFKDFFRYKFHKYIIEYQKLKISIEKSDISHKPVQIQKIKDLVHERNTMIIHEYPVDQIKKVLSIITDAQNEIKQLEFPQRVSKSQSPHNSSIKETEKKLEKIIKKYELEKDISVEKVKTYIFNANGEIRTLINKYHKEFLPFFLEKEDIDINEVLSVFEDARNNFPHKALNGLSPNQKLNEKMNL